MQFSICFFLSLRDVDDVHDMMDDIEEQNVMAQEISDALSTPFGFNQELDDVSIIILAQLLYKVAMNLTYLS